jgi:hypothetical protein
MLFLVERIAMLAASSAKDDAPQAKFQMEPKSLLPAAHLHSGVVSR